MQEITEYSVLIDGRRQEMTHGATVTRSYDAAKKSFGEYCNAYHGVLIEVEVTTRHIAMTTST